MNGCLSALQFVAATAIDDSIMRNAYAGVSPRKKCIPVILNVYVSAKVWFIVTANFELNDATD